MFPFRDHNPSGRSPYVTVTLMVINVLVFLAYYPASDPAQEMAIYSRWGIIPARILSGTGWETVITHMFLHAGWMHLAGNMLFLWVFGDNLEDEMGHFGFLAFYLACGFAAAVAQILPDPWSLAPMVGASGAIAGVLGGYLLMYPKARVDVLLIIIILIRIVTLPAWLVLGAWFGVQMISVLAAGESGVAYMAHAGGFVAGLLLVVPMWRRKGGRGFWQRSLGAPEHPVPHYPIARSNIPKIPRRD